jgi:hypothetical protein
MSFQTAREISAAGKCFITGAIAQTRLLTSVSERHLDKKTVSENTEMQVQQHNQVWLAALNISLIDYRRKMNN